MHVRQLVMHDTAVLMHKIISGKMPSQISEHFQDVSAVHSHNTGANVKITSIWREGTSHMD